MNLRRIAGQRAGDESFQDQFVLDVARFRQPFVMAIRTADS